MMRDRIEVCEMERCEHYELEPDTFVLREDMGWKWAQRVMFFLLAKIGAFNNKKVVTYKRHVIDADKFMERLFKARRAVIEEANRNPTTLLIGPDEYYELMGSEATRNFMQFTADIHSVGRHGERKIMNMRVVMVPWMNGILPVTDDILR